MNSEIRRSPSPDAEKTAGASSDREIQRTRIFRALRFTSNAPRVGVIPVNIERDWPSVKKRVERNRLRMGSIPRTATRRLR
jgi:hypothetical protein